MATTWNPADKSASIILSGGNLTATHNTTSAPDSARATAAIPSGGKVYWESTPGRVSAGTTGSTALMAIANSAASLTTYMGFAGTNSIGFFENGVVYVNSILVASGLPTFGAGDVVRFAVDLANAKAWIAVNGGLWNNSGAASPATNTGGVSLSGLAAGPYYPAQSLHGAASPDFATTNFGASPYAYAPPAGFTPMENASGALTKTLGNVSLASAGSAAINGSVSKAIGAVLIAAAASQPRTGAAVIAIASPLLTSAKGGGSLRATLGPIKAGGFLFKWDRTTATAETWTRLSP